MQQPPPSRRPVRRCRLLVRGRVQGVGFRPTLYRALTARGLAGSIRNTPEGVVIEAEGPAEALDKAVRDLRSLAPARARVDELIVEEVAPLGETEFRIIESTTDGPSLLPIPADLATCAECAAELRAPPGRRAGYPFDTCAACGPRFTIATQVPFDRATSTMIAFPPCPDCAREYADPADRRFHAQTISCPACGPTLAFLCPDGATRDRPLERARALLMAGGILAVKGLGGFHLACDATRPASVERLRKRKGRPAKPFAIMAADLAACERLCEVSEFERQLLTSPQSPIVLLRKRAGCPVAEAVAPRLAELGVMLPYTPLHLMLWEDGAMPPALVMTSCNRADEPLSITHQQVLAEMGDVVDGVLTHNREVRNRCDDSVVAAVGRRVMLMRRSRGYAPEPILLDEEGPPVLATGGMNKVTFALTSGRRVFLSQHIGDVSDADSAAFFAQSFGEFSRLLRIEPQAVVCDLHPDYPTTEFARAIAAERRLPLLQVQHHYAHVVGCMAEHAHRGPVIGVSWDGTGYGEDGAVWGGEFLLADRLTYRRAYHLRYVPMPGGEQAIRRPLLMALAHLAQALGRPEAARRLADRMGRTECAQALQVMERPQFSPPTSSAGRLFDAVSAFLGICELETYEGQPAIEMEAAASAEPGRAQGYGFSYDGGDIVTGELWRGICADADRGEPAGRIAARFHATMAHIIVETCGRMRRENGVATVALSGGVMQNRTLLGQAVAALEADGFRVLVQSQAPPNDAGTSLGQAAWALARLKS